MRYEWFIAKRYLRPQGGATFIFHLTLISIAGVALGVTSLITVISVMNGFGNDLRAKILQGRSHLVLNYDALENYEAYMPLFSSVDNVAACSPAIIYRGVIYATDYPGFGEIFPFFAGIDPRYESDASGLKNNMIVGDLSALEREKPQASSSQTMKINQEPPAQELPGIVIGIEMAADLFGVATTAGNDASEMEAKRKSCERILDQRITLITLPKNADAFNASVTKAKIFRIAGVFSSGHYEFDSSWCYISIPAAQYLLNIPGKITQIQFWLNDHNREKTIETQIAVDQINRERVRQGGFAQTWMQMNSIFFEALEIEKHTMDYILKIIILVATFNIIATLFMVVTEKTRDIGLLRAIGAGRRNVMVIFLLLGLIVGALGTLIGVGGGYAICKFIQTFQLELPGGGMIYYLKYLPCDMEFSDFLSVSLYTTAVSFLASIYPAVRASRLVPVEALRFS